MTKQVLNCVRCCTVFWSTTSIQIMLALLISLVAMIGWDYTAVAPCWNWTNAIWKAFLVCFGWMAGSGATIAMLLIEKDEQYHFASALFMYCMYVVLAQVTGTASSSLWCGVASGPHILTALGGFLLVIPILAVLALVVYGVMTCWKAATHAYASAQEAVPDV